LDIFHGVTVVEGISGEVVVIVLENVVGVLILLHLSVIKALHHRVDGGFILSNTLVQNLKGATNYTQLRDNLLKSSS